MAESDGSLGPAGFDSDGGDDSLGAAGFESDEESADIKSQDSSLGPRGFSESPWLA